MGKRMGEDRFKIGGKQKSLCPFSNYPLTAISTALDITYRIQQVRHTDYEFYCGDIEYKSRNLYKYSWYRGF